MRTALLLLFSTVALADPAADVLNVFTAAAEALTNDDSAAFLDKFDRNMAGYATLETNDSELRDDFRLRAIGAGIAVGVIAGIVLLLSYPEAPGIWAGLTERVWTWPLIWLTTILALVALYALWTRRFELARVCAAWGRVLGPPIRVASTPVLP